MNGVNNNSLLSMNDRFSKSELMNNPASSSGAATHGTRKLGESWIQGFMIHGRIMADRITSLFFIIYRHNSLFFFSARDPGGCHNSLPLMFPFTLSPSLSLLFLKLHIIPNINWNSFFSRKNSAFSCIFEGCVQRNRFNRWWVKL